MREAVSKLQENMLKAGVDIMIIPTSDYHASEYISNHFKEIPFLSGFTGSNATMLVTTKKAYLWTDGRYFIQAEQELKGSGIILEKQGVEGYPSLLELVENLVSSRRGLLSKKDKSPKTIALDFRLVSVGFYKKLADLCNKYSLELINKNLVDDVFDTRPALDFQPIWILEKKYSGETSKKKIARLRTAMDEAGCNGHIISSLCDIAWLLNLRGNDIESVPVFMSYMIVSKTEIILYVHEAAIDLDVATYLNKLGVTIRDYELIYSDLASAHFVENTFGNDAVTCLLDPSTVNASIYSLAKKHMSIIEGANPTSQFKAVKNATEIANSKKAHIRDGIAMVRFMYYLKTYCYNNPELKETEISLTRYLHKLRKIKKGFIEDSFETISAYGSNGAIVHYTASPDSDAKIKPEGLYLVDSGGHYIEGTTDITRTFALGPVTEDMKRDYTLVLKANLRLANYKFLKGCSGQNLDAIARGPIWEAGKDYKHGTGHGVGHILSVHEGPNNISCHYRDGSKPVALEPGMITTDEPGLYIEGQYGIRLENELLCVEDTSNEFGQFYSFEVLTLCPFDHDCIDLDMLSDQELKWLNEYHALVHDKLIPYLKDDEADWLTDACVELVR